MLGSTHCRLDLRRSRWWLPVLLLGGCLGAVSGPTITTTAYGVSEQLPVEVSRPDGPGPFPAVVIMHDCSGLGAGSSGAPRRWARELVSRGYVVVMPDSFTTRGHPHGVCTAASAPRRAEVGPARRAGDAHAALAYARALGDVDGRRVGIMGGSRRGATTGGDAAAWADSIREVTAFFDRHLGRKGER